jgi:hypothetical protein
LSRRTLSFKKAAILTSFRVFYGSLPADGRESKIDRGVLFPQEIEVKVIMKSLVKKADAFAIRRSYFSFCAVALA